MLFRSGTICGAGLDAIKQEPVDPNFPLLSLDNVIIYPHIGGNTTEAAHRASYFAAMGVEEVYEGKKPTWPINDVDYATAPTYTDTRSCAERLHCGCTPASAGWRSPPQRWSLPQEHREPAHHCHGKP